MKKAIRLQFLLILILFVISFQSFGFWIGVRGQNGLAIHQNITAEAANEYKYTPLINYVFCKDGCSFTDEVIEVLKEGNMEMDGGAAGGIPSFHCDDEKIQECSNIIYNGRRKIVNAIIAFSRDLKSDSDAKGNFENFR